MTREEKLITTIRNVITTIRQLPPDEMTTTEITVVEALENVLADCEPAEHATDLVRLGAPLT